VSTSPRRIGVALAALAAVILTGCSDAPKRPTPAASGSSAPAPSSSATAPAADPATRAAALVGKLTDEDLAGQVLMPYAYGSSATKVSAGSAAGNRALAGVDTPAEMIAKYRKGGLILVAFTPTTRPRATRRPPTSM
jgi:beta-N-acetylhexosaminidase